MHFLVFQHAEVEHPEMIAYVQFPLR